MPHIIIKAWPGKTEAEKHRLAEAITRNVTEIFQYGEESVSVAYEEISPDRWKPEVYEPEIVARTDTLLKKPGYRM